MDDIVKRLREPRLTAYHGLRAAAADEIERLRAQVDAIKTIMAREMADYKLAAHQLTDLGKHGRLVVGLIDKDIKRALSSAELRHDD